MSSAEYQRQWRARKGANTGKPGRPRTRPCGTLAAYARHRRHQEQPCVECASAWAQYVREYRAGRG